jgi:2'-5' RNA ligase
LKNYSIGIGLNGNEIPPIESQKQKLRELFVNLDIPVNWVSQERMAITVLSIGHDLNQIQNIYYKFKLRDFKYDKFIISFGPPKIGMTSKYRELVYMPIEKGADELRELLLLIANKINFHRTHSFIPHLTLGRVSKDLSEQEFRNLKHEVEFLNPIREEITHLDDFNLSVFMNDWDNQSIEYSF